MDSNSFSKRGLSWNFYIPFGSKLVSESAYLSVTTSLGVTPLGESFTEDSIGSVLPEDTVESDWACFSSRPHLEM